MESFVAASSIKSCRVLYLSDTYLGMVNMLNVLEKQRANSNYVCMGRKHGRAPRDDRGMPYNTSLVPANGKMLQRSIKALLCDFMLELYDPINV